MTTTRITAEDFLSRLAEGDAARTAAIFADDVDFLCAGASDVPWIKPRQTRADMEDLFSALHAAFYPDDREASLTSFLVYDDDAVITGHISQRLHANNQAFTVPFALHLTVEDSQITRYHIYEDSLTVAESYRARGPEI